MDLKEIRSSDFIINLDTLHFFWPIFIFRTENALGRMYHSPTNEKGFLKHKTSKNLLGPANFFKITCESNARLVDFHFRTEEVNGKGRCANISCGGIVCKLWSFQEEPHASWYCTKTVPVCTKFYYTRHTGKNWNSSGYFDLPSGFLSSFCVQQVLTKGPRVSLKGHSFARVIEVRKVKQ